MASSCCAWTPVGKGSRVVTNVFARGKIAYRVTTNRMDALDLFFGGAPGEGDTSSVVEHVVDMDTGEDEGEVSEDVSAASDNELVKLVNKIIVDAYQQGVSDIHVEPGGERKRR